MKNEPAQSLDMLRSQPLPLIKLLSLATVTWGVLGHGWLDMLGGGWLIWVLLGLLLLLDAGGGDARPADWSHGISMFGRILGPAILPFYAALCLLLAVGPSYVRQTPVFTLPPKGGSQPNRLGEAPGSTPFTPNSYSAPKPGSFPPGALPGTMNAPSSSSSPPRPFKRPGIPQTPPTGNVKFQPPTPTVPAGVPRPVSSTPAPAPQPAVPASSTSKAAPVPPGSSARPLPADAK